MKEIGLKILMFAYATGGAIALLAYWPTIRDLVSGKKSANITSYLIWTVCSGTTFLYSLFVLPDVLFRIVSGVGFFACTIVLILALRIRNK